MALGRPEEIAWAVAAPRGTRRPPALIVVFDDIHWAEPTFLDLVEYVADWSREAPILLVCLARPSSSTLGPAGPAGS